MMISRVITQNMAKLKNAVKHRLPRSHFVRNVGLVAGGTALAQGIGILTAPILTRLYSVEDFGAFAVYSAVFAVALAVGSLRYELALPLAEDEQTAGRILVLCWILSGVTTVLFALLMATVTWVWRPITGFELPLVVLVIFPFGLFAAGFYQSLTFWAVREQVYAEVARTKFIQACSLTLTQLGLGVVAASSVGLILGHMFGQVGGTLSLFRYIWRNNRAAFNEMTWQALWRVAVRYRRFPFFASGSALLNSAGLSLPSLLFAMLYGDSVAGWLALGQRVMSVPISLLGQAVAQVYLGTASELKQDQPDELKHLFVKTTQRLFLLGVLPTVIAMIWSPQIFAWVFGAEWETAGVYVRVLAPTFLLRFIVSPVSQTANILEYQQVQFLGDLVRVVTLAGLFVAAVVWQLPTLTTMVLFSVLMSLTYAGYLWIYWRLVTR